MFSDLARASCKEFVYVCGVLINFTVVDIGDFLQVFADFLLLWRNKLSISGAHIVFQRGFLHIGQINFKDLFWVPVSVVQIQKTHLVDFAFLQEYFFRAKVRMHKLFLVEHADQIDHFQNQIDRRYFCEYSGF
jgi:hypothetical protein